MPAIKPRRWFRFSLGAFFVLLTLFGVWLGVQVKWMRDRDEARKSAAVVSNHSNLGSPAPFALRILGENGVWELMVNPNETARYKRLFPEAKYIHESPYTQQFLRELQQERNSRKNLGESTRAAAP